MPEALIQGREAIWLRYFFSQWCYDPECIGGEDFETYVKSYARSGAVRGALADYRAAPQDVEQDKEDAGVKIACPTLCLWGEQSPAIIGLFDMKTIWQEMASHLTTVTIPHCGHLPPEEQPELVNQAMLKFLGDWEI